MWRAFEGAHVQILNNDSSILGNQRARDADSACLGRDVTDGPQVAANITIVPFQTLSHSQLFGAGRSRENRQAAVHVLPFIALKQSVSGSKAHL